MSAGTATSIPARLRADHRSHSSTAAVTPDVPRPVRGEASTSGRSPCIPRVCRTAPSRVSPRRADDGKYAYSWYENAHESSDAEEASVDGDASGAGLTSHP